MAYKFNPFTGNLDFASEANEEVFTYPDINQFPIPGESGKIYIDASSNQNYYWTGGNYQLLKSNNATDVFESYSPLPEVVNDDLIRDGLGNVYYPIDDNQYSSGFDENNLCSPVNVVGGDLTSMLTDQTVNGWQVTGNTVTITNNHASFNLNQSVANLNLLDKYIASDRWRVKVRARVNFTPGGNTFGIGVGLKSMSQVEKYSLLGRVGTAADPFLGRSIISHNQNGNFNVNIADSGANTIPISNNDVISVEVSLRDQVFTVTSLNETTDNQCSVQYSFPLTTGHPYFLPNMGSPALWIFGGSFEIYEFSYQVNEVEKPDLIIIGDSKVKGYNSGSFSNRWTSIIKTYNPRTVVLSGIANTASDLQMVVNNSRYFNINIPESRPLTAIIALGSNDVRFNNPNIQINYDTLYATITASGVRVYPSLLLNEGVIDVNPFNNYLTLAYNQYVLLPQVDVVNTDNIHPDATSHHKIANIYIHHAPNILKRRYYDNEVIIKSTLQGVKSYKKINVTDKVQEITNGNQLPRVGNNYKLKPRVTYILKGLIYLGDSQIIADESNTILGYDKSDDGIIYTGTGSAIVSINQTLTISNIFTSHSNGSLIQFIGREGLDSLQIRECIIGSGSIGTVQGGNIIAFNNNICSVNMSGGLTISGQVRNLGISTNYFANETAARILYIPSGTFRTVKISDNDFRVNNIGIEINPNVVFTTQGGGHITDNIFSGLASPTNRIVGIEDDTTFWILENNTGLVSTSDGYSPNTIKVLSDDFMVGGIETGEIGQYNWQFTNGSMSNTNAAETGRPGVVRRASGTTANQICSFYMGRATNAPNFSYNDYVSNIWIVRLVDDVATTVIQIGASSNWGALNPAHSFYFEKTESDTTWQAVSRNNGIQTKVDTLIPVVQNQYYKLEIKKHGDTIKYKIDDQLVATITTNIPDGTDLLHFGNLITTTTGAVRNLDIDYFSAIIKTTNR
jgi:hypothetical protein